ncbi:hypothetical protein chiPu_0023163 [Chiloscyllium punctatum]|uniref:Uncharacterized protein n=1 Tax=Chiloscyllium punctatum TaxID=137246 RepID=A0A401T872_CHIPU|nr:hypothetical protein [Chiloscyllium punctatum]
MRRHPCLKPRLPKRPAPIGRGAGAAHAPYWTAMLYPLPQCLSSAAFVWPLYLSITRPLAECHHRLDKRSVNRLAPVPRLVSPPARPLVTANKGATRCKKSPSRPGTSTTAPLTARRLQCIFKNQRALCGASVTEWDVPFL